MRVPHSTTGEPKQQPAFTADDGLYLELVYRVRPARASEFGEPQHLRIIDHAYVGRRDTQQWFGPEVALPETDTQTSRYHGMFVLTRGDHLDLTYHDLGSENGSYIGAEQVTRCSVVTGTTIRLGQGLGRSEVDVVAVNTVRPDPDDYWPSATFGRLRGGCAPLRRVFAGINALVQNARDNPVVVVNGAAGTGKKAIAWELCRRWYGRELPEVHYVDGRWLSVELDQCSLEELLARRSGEVLMLDRLHGLSIRHQRELAGLLRRRLDGPPGGHRMLVLTGSREPDVREPTLVKLLRVVPSLHLPSAATCGADEIEGFAKYFLQSYQDNAPHGGHFAVGRCAFTKATIGALREEAWPGNWRQLQTTVETAALTTALDHRETIELGDLQLGFSELNLPLEILYEMPLAEAEQIFRRGYLMWKFRKYAGNLTWIAPEAEFTKRGLLKTAQNIGLHDGDQVVWAPPRAWTLQNPHYTREANRLRVCLPSSAVWLALIKEGGHDEESARKMLLELLDAHPAATVEHTLGVLLRNGERRPAQLLKLLKGRAK